MNDDAPAVVYGPVVRIVMPWWTPNAGHITQSIYVEFKDQQDPLLLAILERWQQMREEAKTHGGSGDFFIGM